MPQVAITALAGVLAPVVGALAAKFIATVFVYAASTYLLNRAAKKALRRSPAGISGAEVNYFDTGAPLRIVYGRVRTGGMETLPPLLSGLQSQMLHKVITLAGHEVDSYNAVYFDTTTITNAQIGAMGFTNSDGMVTGAFSGHAFIRRYRGTLTDSLDRMLLEVGSSAFASFRGLGIAKTAISLLYNENIYRAIPDVTFLYQGKRLYDPRLDSTPGAAPTNPSFIAWSRNPALALADYLMADYGGSYVSADIDWTTVVNAANYCDGLVNIPGAATQARYTCNGVLLATDKFEDNVKTLVDSMLGRIMYRDGTWRMFAGSWQTPSFTVTKADWISGLSIRFEQGKKKRFNRMRCWFVDPERNWQRVECVPRVNTTYAAADKGETIDAETEQLLCTDKYEAQRKAEFLLRQSRNQIIVAGRLPPRFQDIALWDTGTLAFDHLGWSSKTFRAVSLDMNEDGSIDAVFAEEQSGDWTDLASGDYGLFSTAALPATNVTTPSEPRSFTVTPQVNGTILFGFDPPIVNPAGTQVQIIRSTNSADASVGTVVWQGIASPVPLVMPVSRHWYYARSVSPSSAYSAYTPNTFGTFGVARLEADQTLQQRLVGDAEMEYSEAASLWILTHYVPTTAQTMLLGTGTAVESITYNQTGGQYGGYINFTRATVNSLSYRPLIIAANAVNTQGYAHNGHASAIEYSLRFRCNSFNGGGGGNEEFRVATLASFKTPSSTAGVYVINAEALVTSAMIGPVGLGNWVTCKVYGIQAPTFVTTQAGLPFHVSSAYEQHLRACIHMVAGATVGNFDIDYFQANNLGHINYPVTTIPAFTLQLYERYSMSTITMINSSVDATVTFSLDTNASDGDWRRWQIGRRFTINKGHALRPVYISPASGMTLMLSGRAAVGTVTMISSLSARASIEKIGNAEFLVDGVGLI